MKKENRMEKVRLGEVATFVNGYAFKPSDWSTEGLEIIRIQNLTKSGASSNYYSGNLPEKYKIRKGNILISWSATLDIFVWDGNDAWLNQHIFKVVFDKIEINEKYFIYAIKKILGYMRSQVHGATMQHITKGKFDNLEIPLPPLDAQKRIATLLDTAESLRQKDKAVLQKYDALAQSLFLELFGDPVRNEKGWEIDSLSNFGDLKNGLNFSGSEKGERIGYLTVGDFKSLYKISDVNSLKDIELTKMPSKDFILKDGDIVFVRSNGNKQLIGRCLAVYPNKNTVTFSGFCIRYRISNAKLTSDYLVHLFRIQSFKEVMLEGGRGANIQNINQKLLNDLKVPIPPIELQNQFAEQIQLIEKQKELVQENLKKSEALFMGLLGGEF